ncbi:uncharacterized protein LOC102033179 [Geospiza fortis]|uniref:Uncharacterized protein LOC102033179 n=1 Tax=Geospiza fortis TaxID=48883 RepID=A0A8N5EYE1_GEOFO|nr:uncharacterized protein LOC102033179 [Geospiza fortis]
MVGTAGHPCPLLEMPPPPGAAARSSAPPPAPPPWSRLPDRKFRFPVADAHYVCHYLEGDTVLARSSELHVLVEELRLPRPDLSVLPGHEVAVGAEVMFRCTITQPSTGCFLYLEGQIRAQLFPREQGSYNFSLVQKGDRGRYSCQCFIFNAPAEWSAVSNTLDLAVRDYTLCNAVRLALAAGLLLLLGLMVAEAAWSRDQ